MNTTVDGTTKPDCKSDKAFVEMFYFFFTKPVKNLNQMASCSEKYLYF